MKDSIITVKRKKIEINILVICFIIANVLNIFAIAFYRTHWIELITKIHIILIITAFFYLLTLVFRGIYFLLTYPFRLSVRKKTEVNEEQFSGA